MYEEDSIMKLVSKSIISFILFTAILGSLFTGCGSDSKNAADQNQATTTTAAVNQQDSSVKAKAPVTLKFQSCIVTKQSGELIEKLAQEYSATHPDVKIDIEMTPWANYTDKIINSVAAGIIPDGAVVKFTWYPMLQDHLAPIDEYFNNWQYKDEVEPIILEQYRSVTPEKDLYFLPYTNGALFFYYRKDLFAEAGITKTPDTWDEFLEDAIKLTKDKDNDGKIDQYGYTMRSAANGHETWYCFAFANMKEPSFYNEKGEFSFISPEITEGNQFFLDLFKKYKVVPTTAPTDGTNENVAYLKSGQAAMMIQSIQQSVTLSEALGDKLGVFKIPAGKNGKRFVGGGETCFGTFKESKIKEEVFKFESWLLEPEQHRRIIATGDTEVFMASVKEEAVKNNIFQAISVESLPELRFAPPNPYMAQFGATDWPAIISKGLLTDISSADICKELQDKLFPN
jgi:multiple sugar transport system substrate-binding protein